VGGREERGEWGGRGNFGRIILLGPVA